MEYDVIIERVYLFFAHCQLSFVSEKEGVCVFVAYFSIRIGKGLYLLHTVRPVQAPQLIAEVCKSKPRAKWMKWIG